MVSYLLRRPLQSFKERLGNCQKAFDEKVAELISTHESRSELQEYYSSEDARLRRLVTSEKNGALTTKMPMKEKYVNSLRHSTYKNL